MKKIIGITSIIATLISPATFATGAVDGACRKLNREILEMPLGGPSNPWTITQDRELVSLADLTDHWPAPLEVLNNVSVRVEPNTPADTKAQFIVSTNKGVFISPYIERDNSIYGGSDNYCFELGNSLKTTPRNEILDISVQFKGTGEEGVAITSLGYIGVPEGATGYTVVDHVEPSQAPYPSNPVTLNFDIPNNYSEYLLVSDQPLFPFSHYSATLICDDHSTHYLSSYYGTIEPAPSFALKLRTDGLCTVNSKLVLNSGISGTEFWLQGK